MTNDDRRAATIKKYVKSEQYACGLDIDRVKDFIDCSEKKSYSASERQIKQVLRGLLQEGHVKLMIEYGGVNQYNHYGDRILPDAENMDGGLDYIEEQWDRCGQSEKDQPFIVPADGSDDGSNFNIAMKRLEKSSREDTHRARILNAYSQSASNLQSGQAGSDNLQSTNGQSIEMTACVSADQRILNDLTGNMSSVVTCNESLAEFSMSQTNRDLDSLFAQVEKQGNEELMEQFGQTFGVSVKEMSTSNSKPDITCYLIQKVIASGSYEMMASFRETIGKPEGMNDKVTESLLSLDVTIDDLANKQSSDSSAANAQ